MISPKPKQQSVHGATILFGLFLIGFILRLVIVVRSHLTIIAVAPAIALVIVLRASKSSFNMNFRPSLSFSL